MSAPTTADFPMTVSPATAAALPPWPEVVSWLSAPERRHAVDVLRAARRPFVQPRCGVGEHARMLASLRTLDQAGPGLLSVTIDSHTRLGHFGTAARVLRERPADLNGYPLLAHGWERGRELAAAAGVPLEVRHGSPEARDLFACTLASGITSFEGGGIGYNLPYCKDVPLRDSLESWREVDTACGELAAAGVVVDRELFGTLTGVLMPPSISLACAFAEARLAADAGVRCVSIAYPQSGEVYQDTAALRAIPALAGRYLPAHVEVHPVLHEFMGVFPRCPGCARSLILLGALTARLGGAAKVINKTVHEASGIPSAEVNADGIRCAQLGLSPLLDFVELDEGLLAEECGWLRREVTELLDPVLDAADPLPRIVSAFARGTLDVPFSASVHAKSVVVPGRDARGAIRYRDFGALPFSPAVRRHNDACARRPQPAGDLLTTLSADINHFAAGRSCERCAATPTGRS
ncbi:methylaspartate mutase E subunit [Amycolatopsis mediterranei S699]|uniref:Methylaspartate mutase E subunit n=2 Tax=Amycolatopsis mediterranei TaxID=33910 RepID=A0A0H3DAJ6_AMYMU|nr:methylaspartate mutase [Amycolatopsis mediterranei]ADJ46564.1 methylaspartate mutase E subunit [Amycolatopsis mediterranei U32]AEK43365.1 methylaspartate mutase E subunit [Amycolatopsis mediterranei S699]AFO78275.1 methylaspartate mutase E subunit [Amycolatopsis mediterranei S699]AGT85403.1 methylaspartate mutase E subunit [Amycolatopsis mediterranei RB]KDO11533.1 methylaspartate mutase [Amycolatopsis mediterranei]